jgi:multiple sugar transport system permease protein
MKTHVLPLLGTHQFVRLIDIIFWSSLILVCLVPAALLIWFYFPTLRGGNTITVLTQVVYDNDKNWESIGRTLIYTLITVAGQCLLGVATAVSVYEIRNSRLRGFFAAAFVLPYAIPSFASVLGWKLMLGDATPLASLIARLLDLQSTNILGHSSTAFLILCIVSIWQFFPFVFFFVYGALLGMSRKTLNCAASEGLDSLQRLLTIFVPQILPILGIVVLLRFLFMFSKYDTAALLGAKALVEPLRILPVLIYEKFTTTTRHATRETSILLIALLVFSALLIAIYLLLRYCAKRHSISTLLVSGPFLNKLYVIIRVATLVFTLAFVAAPIVSLIEGSFLPSPELDRGISSLSFSLRSYTLENYSYTTLKDVFLTFKGPIVNSSICVSLVAAISILWSAYFGYRLTRSLKKFSYILYPLVLFTYSLPPIVLIQPFSFIGNLFSFPTILVIAMSHLCFIMPFCLLLAQIYFEMVPSQFDVAIANDGASPMQSLVGVFIRRLLPEFVMIAIFASIISWNDILFSRYLGPDLGSKTLVDVLADYLNQSSYQTEYGKISSLSVIMAIIITIVFVAVQNRVLKRAQERSEKL